MTTHGTGETHDIIEIPIESLEQFFGLAGETTIALPLCLECRRFHWYPMERCPHCHSARLTWAPIDGAAHVYSTTIVRYAFTVATRGKTPYGLALVTFDDAPDVRMVCRVSGGQVAVGDAVMVSVEPDVANSDTGMVSCSASSPGGQS